MFEATSLTSDLHIYYTGLSCLTFSQYKHNYNKVKHHVRDDL